MKIGMIEYRKFYLRPIICNVVYIVKLKRGLKNVYLKRTS